MIKARCPVRDKTKFLSLADIPLWLEFMGDEKKYFPNFPCPIGTEESGVSKHNSKRAMWHSYETVYIVPMLMRL